MIRRPIQAAAVGLLLLAAAACGGGGSGTAASGSGAELSHPNDVGNGHRVIYVLEDASCDMTSARDMRDRVLALKVGVYTAAFDAGIVERGVVRQLASQNVLFDEEQFTRDGSSSILRTDNVLDQIDHALAALRPLAGSAKGQACRSDLLGALASVALQQKVVAQKIGASAQKDIIFVTNGLIVDPARKIVLTRDPVEKSKIYNQDLKRIRATWTPPNLHGFKIWLVGLGYNESITTERGPAVQKMWQTILKPTGAIVEPIESAATGLPTNLAPVTR